MDSREAARLAPVVADGCEFCSPSGHPQWFNTPVAQEGHAKAVPSVGSLVPGYLLALPTAHVTASCRIAASDKADFESFVNKLSSQLTSIYGKPVTIFEHGACAAERGRQSACVSHAHVHLVPGSYDLSTEAPVDVDKHGSLLAFMQEERTNAYLMLQDPGGPLLSFKDRAYSQFFRRVIARRLGVPDCWDYAVHPFFDNVERTYQDFGISIP